MTAVEWLVDYIENQNKCGYEFHPKYAEHIVQQAKKMEKQQIGEAYEDGYSDSDNTFELNKEYYNEKFKNK